MRFLSKNIANRPEIMSVLNELAYELSSNYCTTSFGEIERSAVDLTDIFAKDSICLKNLEKGNRKVSDIQRHRNILVIGAGASHDSYKCIPLGKQMIDELLRKYENRIEQFDALKQKYEKRKENMKQERGIEELDFEGYMSLFSEFILTEEQVREFLQEFTNYKNSPSLFYEIAAHMFKHSFIDVIINFNFDELLDNVIEEELGKDNYKFVLSDGDCIPVEEAMVDGRIKTPLYIKPHGTVSHGSSLRFTKSHYLEMSGAMRKLITDLVRGCRGDDKSLITKVNLICVGFNMESVEFKKILQDHLPYESRIFHFMCSNPGTEDTRFKEEFYVRTVLGDFFKRVRSSLVRRRTKSYDKLLNSSTADRSISDEKLSKEIYRRVNIFGFNEREAGTGTKSNELTSPFSELFSLLWRITENQFKKSYAPRSISRHEIISYLFYDTAFSKFSSGDPAFCSRQMLRESTEDNVLYYRDRVLVELAISINRNRGVVDIDELTNDRAGLYYEKYKAAHRKSAGKKRGNKLYTLYDLVEFFMPEKEKVYFKYSRNLFKLEPVSGEDIIEDLKNFQSNRNFLVINEREDEKEQHGSVQLDQGLIELFKEILTSGDFFDKRNYVTPTIIYYLLKCPLLSSRLMVNLRQHYRLICYNGKLPDKKNTKPNRMFVEICRLMNKSLRNHYFQIKPRYEDRKNLVIESIAKRNIIHTNLSLDYSIRKILMEEHWDRLLAITEVGSFFHYLRHINEETPLHGLFSPVGKKIVMLNSLEAIESYNYEAKKKRLIPDCHVKELFSFLNYSKTDFAVDARVMPFWQHNDHMLLFLKRIEDYDKQISKEYPYFPVFYKSGKATKGFAMIGAFYMYRRGFSNQISPIYVGSDPYGKDVNLINNDYHRLLSRFYINYQRTQLFHLENMNKASCINIDSFDSWNNNKSFLAMLTSFMETRVW